MAKKKSTKPVEKMDESENLRPIPQRALKLGSYSDKVISVAERRQITTHLVDGPKLKTAEKLFLASLPTLPAKLNKKLSKSDNSFTMIEIHSIVNSIIEETANVEPKQLVSLLLVAKKLIDCLKKTMAKPKEPERGKKGKSIGQIYQFKIKYIDSSRLWRRIQVKDCTIDKLNEYVLTAIGQMSYAFYHISDGRQFFGDPMLMEEKFEEFQYTDSTRTKISDICLPKDKRTLRLRFEVADKDEVADDYEEDTDGEEVEEDAVDVSMLDIEFEKKSQAVPGVKYPLCVDGEGGRAPEGMTEFLYSVYLHIIQDPTHEEYEMFKKEFPVPPNPEIFDAAAATKSMREGFKIGSR